MKINKCGVVSRCLLVAAVFVFGIFIYGSATASSLQIFTEENKPLNFTENGKITGYATEVAQEIMKRLNVNYPISVVPWPRGYEAVQKEPDTMLYSTMKTPERVNMFKFVGPITTVVTSFYGKKGANIKIKSLDDAKKLPIIGVARKNYTEEFLTKEGFKNLDFGTTIPDVVKKFAVGRYNVFPAHNFQIEDVLGNEKLSMNDVEELFEFMPPREHYFAFSLSTSDDVINSWQKALDSMKKDGTFAKIYKKWLPGKRMPK